MKSTFDQVRMFPQLKKAGGEMSHTEITDVDFASVSRWRDAYLDSTFTGGHLNRGCFVSDLS